MASTAVSTVAKAVMMMTGISGTLAWKRFSPSSPSMPGMRRSVTMTSNSARSSAGSASATEAKS